MTHKAAKSLSAWMFILAAGIILSALFFFHWVAGLLGLGVLLWKVSEAVWTWSATTKDTADEN